MLKEVEDSKLTYKSLSIEELKEKNICVSWLLSWGQEKRDENGEWRVETEKVHKMSNGKGEEKKENVQAMWLQGRRGREKKRGGEREIRVLMRKKYILNLLMDG